MKRIPIPDIANRISLSAVRKHGIARYIVAVIVAAVALAGAAFGAYALSVEPVALIASDGFALPNDDASDSLHELVSSGSGAPDVKPVAFEAGDALWSGFAGMTVGEDRAPISSTFPLFVNDGAAVQLVSGDDILFTRTYDELEGYQGLIVSEGRAYTEVGAGADEETYRFLKVRGGAFVVLQSLHITAEGMDETLPTGSIVLLTESAVACYRLGDGVFASSRLTIFPQATMVSFGPDREDEQSYDALLRGLGLTSDAKATSQANAAGEEEAEKPKKDKERDRESAEAPQEGGGVVADGSTEPGESELGEWVWVKPEASATDFVPSVYQASSTLTINDPAGVISRPARFEFRRNGELYLRAGFTSSGAITAQGLEPNTTYEIRGYLTYKNRSELEVEEEFFSQIITTGDPSQLEPIQIAFAQGTLFPERLQFDNIAFTGGSSELLANATGLSFEVDGKSFSLSAQLRAKMLAGERVSLKTSASFEPGSTYEARLAGTDRFGNAIPLRASALSMRTCKDAPTARMHLESNDAANLVIGVDLADPYGSLAGDAQLHLYDDAGRLIKSQPLKTGAHTYEFGDLGYDRLLHAEVMCEYDLADGQGIRTGESVASMDFTTVSISVLGHAVYSTTVSDVTDSSATLSVSLNTKQIDARLLALLSHGSVSAGLEGRDPVYTHTFTSQEMAKLRAGEALEYRMTGFSSMTTYQLTTTAGAQIGNTETGIYHEVDTMNRVSSFKTMRRGALVEFAKTAVTSDTIKFDARVVDPDKAIGQNVMLEVRDDSGRLMGEQLRFDQVTSPHDDGWQTELVFDDLAENKTYTVNVIAYNYNLGFDNSTLQGRTTLYSGKITTVDGVSGAITLRGVDAVSGDANRLDARIRVEIADLWRELEPREFTVEVMRDDKLVDSFSRSFSKAQETIDLDPYRIDRSRSTYLFRLVVDLHGQRFVLGETSFSAEDPVVGISTEEELKELPKQNLEGNYILLNDLETTAYYVTGNTADSAFQGTLDFQGYTLRLNAYSSTSPRRGALFHTLGVDGVLKNAVIEVEGTPNGTLADQCYGYISDVKVRVEPRAVGRYSEFGGVVSNLQSTATLENFAVDLGGDIVVRGLSGGAVRSQSGAIRNGYVYGGRFVVYPELLPDEMSGVSQLGGIAAVTYASSSTSSVISAIDIVLPDDYAVKQVGLVAGYRTGGLVDGALATGNLVNYYNVSGTDAACGPLFGVKLGGDASRIKNAYYTSRLDFDALDGSRLVSILALYDRVWYEEYFDAQKGFDLSPVLRECYPHVNFPTVMGAQDYIPLPKRPEVHEPEITAIRVTDQQDERAEVELSFYNPDSFPITKIDVAGANCSILETAQDVDDPSLTRMKLRLSVSGDQQRTSGYSIIGMTYDVYPGNSKHVEYKKDLYVINAEFWRSISTTAEWKSLTNSYENFRLANDLDFQGMRRQDVRIGTFYGKLDGAGHTLYNIAFTDAPNVIERLDNGTVSNLNVANMELKQEGGYGGFLGTVAAGSLVDGVHIRNSKISAITYVSALAGNVAGAEIRNCSASDVELTLFDSKGFQQARAGGLVAYLNGSTLTNSFAQDVRIAAPGPERYGGIGGAVGSIYNSSTVSQVYAVGSIEAYRPGVGGVVGVSESSGDAITNVWSNVDINTMTGTVGGTVGEMRGSSYGRTTSLAVGDVFVSSIEASNVGRSVGTIVASGVDGFYFYNEQLIEGATNEIGTSLGVGELSDARVWTEAMQMSGFDWSEVASGMLPKVLATDGAVLPNQRDNYLKTSEVRVKSISGSMVADRLTVNVLVEHSAGDVITGGEFDWLAADEPVAEKQDATHTVLLYEDVKPKRYYDTYCLTAVTYERGGEERIQPTASHVYFGEPLYKEIANIDDWVNKVESDTYENYRLTGDLDFSGKDFSSGNMGVRIGRLDGRVVDEAMPAIKNIHTEFAPAKTTCSLIETVRTSVSNITFKDISIATDGSTTVNARPALISNMLGSGASGGLRDVEFDNIDILVKPVNDKATGSNAGIVSYLDGEICDVVLHDITLTALDGSAETNHAGNRYGALFAESTSSSSVDGVVASDITVDVSGYYVGSIGGFSYGKASNIITDGEIKVSSRHNSQYSYAGGLFGYCTEIRNVQVAGERSQVEQGGQMVETSSVEVTGASKFVGGIVGNGHVFNAHISNAIVRGEGSVGGLTGIGGINRLGTDLFDPDTASTVEGCIVEGSDNASSTYVGGAAGQANGGNQDNVIVSNTSVSGGSYVGGIIGSTGNVVQYAVAEDVTVDATGDFAGGVGGKLGGVADTGAVDVTVRGRSNVGGIAGSSAYAQRVFALHGDGRKATVAGSSNVAGIAGEFTARSNNHSLISDATVSASAGVAGGLAGSITPVYSAAANNASIMYGVFAGSVSGKTAVGGIAGTTASGILAATGNFQSRGYLVAGSIQGGEGTTGALFGDNAASGNASTNTAGVTYVHNATTVNGVPVTQDDLAALLGCSSTSATVVSKADLTTDADALARYINAATRTPPGMAFSSSFWEVESDAALKAGFFPRVKMYQVGVPSVQPRVSVPNDASTASFKAVGGDEVDGLPKLEGSADLSVYASGVNTFNIEFLAAAQGARFEVLALDGYGMLDVEAASDGQAGETPELAVISEDVGESDDGLSDEAEGEPAGEQPVKGGEEDVGVEDGEALISGVVKQRTYTFAWDFTTPLVVKLYGADGVRSYRIEPSEVMRAAAVWGDTAYWIAADGIRGLDDSLVEGEFVNLYDGRALAADGSVVDVAAGVATGEVAALGDGAVVQSVADAAPIAAGEGWRTFGSYTEVDGGAERDMRLYRCGGDVYGVSSELDTVADGYVIADGDAFAGIGDGASDEGGQQEDSSAAEDAEKAGGAPDAGAFGSDSPSTAPASSAHYRTVLMADGTLRDLADPLVYPDGFKNEGIASMTNTAAARVPLVVVRYDSGLMVCFDYTTGEVKFKKQGSGEDLSLLDYAGGFFDGLVDGLFGGGDAAEGDNGYGDALALEDRASHGGLVGLDSGGSGAAGTGSSGDADGAGDASAGAPGGSAGSGAGAGSSVGGFASGTDYVSVYEPSSGGYVTYAVDDLLNGSFEGVASVNKTYDIPAAGGDPVSVTTQAPAALGAGGLGQTGQVALFSSAILGILAILLFI